MTFGIATVLLLNLCVLFSVGTDGFGLRYWGVDKMLSFLSYLLHLMGHPLSDSHLSVLRTGCWDNGKSSTFPVISGAVSV
jgi:hypothetical protein